MFFNEGLVTVPQIIEDAKRALQANAQISATLTCLALVDECATIEWKNLTMI